MQRVEAWFNHEMLDRPPVRFSQTNAQFNSESENTCRSWPSLKSGWFHAEYQPVVSGIQNPVQRRKAGRA